jgi:hypothetical protein
MLRRLVGAIVSVNHAEGERLAIVRDNVVVGRLIGL